MARQKTPSTEHGDPQEEVFLTESRLANRWDTSPKSLQKQRLDGTGVPYVKIGRLVRYPLTEIRAYEKENLRRSTSEYKLAEAQPPLPTGPPRISRAHAEPTPVQEEFVSSAPARGAQDRRRARTVLVEVRRRRK